MKEELIDTIEELNPIINDVKMYADLLNLSSGTQMDLLPSTLQSLSGKLFDLTLAMEQIKDRLTDLSKR